jgi:hypothetical protein
MQKFQYLNFEIENMVLMVILVFTIAWYFTIFNYKSYLMFNSLNSLSKILHYYEHIRKLIHVLKFWV